jgi:glycerol kinase
MSDILSIALDLGTTSIKAGLLNPHGELVNIVSQPAPPITSTDQHYESDALAYAKVAATVLHECRTHAGRHITLGLCSQRSSMLVWDSKTGMPVTPLISWQDGRGAQSCLDLQQHENQIHALSGLPLTPYYYSGKLRVLLQQNPDWRSRLIEGDWRVGTLDTFLIWRWSSRRHFVTDASMAARTQLLDISTASWSTSLCELFDIPGIILPTVLRSQSMGLALDDGLTLQASVGDQSAAFIAGVQADTHEALANLGTGCFVMRYIAPGETHPAGYLKTLVYRDNKCHLAVEGTLNSIAAALAPYPVAEIEYADLAKHDIYALAEPSGLGAPYFRKHLGLQFSASVEHLTQRDIAALLLEAVIFRVARIMEDMHRAHPLERLYLSGGLANLSALQQGIAQCVPCAVSRLEQSESSLLGTAMLAAGLHPGSLRKVQEITVEVDNQKLVEKFQRWKDWLDNLLCSS